MRGMESRRFRDALMISSEELAKIKSVNLLASAVRDGNLWLMIDALKVPEDVLKMTSDLQELLEIIKVRTADLLKETVEIYDKHFEK